MSTTIARRVATSLAAGGTIGAGAIASGVVAFDVTTLPSAHATRAQVFCIADDLAILPGSGGDGGLRVYDPDETDNYLQLYHDGTRARVENATLGPLWLVSGDGESVQILGSAASSLIAHFQPNAFDDSPPSNGNDRCMSTSVVQARRFACYVMAAAPTVRANHADYFSMDVASSAESFIQNEAGVSRQMTGLEERLASAVTNATTTLANLTELTQNVLAGRKYAGRLVLPINNGLAADGYKFDLGGGSATITSIHYGIANLIGATLGTRTSTALTTALTVTALADTSDVYVEIPVTVVVNAAGTIIPRQAKNADAAGATLTHRVGGYFHLVDTV